MDQGKRDLETLGFWLLHCKYYFVRREQYSLALKGNMWKYAQTIGSYDNILFQTTKTLSLLPRGSFAIFIHPKNQWSRWNPTGVRLGTSGCVHAGSIRLVNILSARQTTFRIMRGKSDIAFYQHSNAVLILAGLLSVCKIQIWWSD